MEPVTPPRAVPDGAELPATSCQVSVKVTVDTKQPVSALPERGSREAVERVPQTWSPESWVTSWPEAPQLSLATEQVL